MEFGVICIEGNNTVAVSFTEVSIKLHCGSGGIDIQSTVEVGVISFQSGICIDIQFSGGTADEFSRCCICAVEGKSLVIGNFNFTCERIKSSSCVQCCIFSDVDDVVCITGDCCCNFQTFLTEFKGRCISGISLGIKIDGSADSALKDEFCFFRDIDGSGKAVVAAAQCLGEAGADICKCSIISTDIDGTSSGEVDSGCCGIFCQGDCLTGCDDHLGIIAEVGLIVLQDDFCTSLFHGDGSGKSGNIAGDRIVDDPCSGMGAVQGSGSGNCSGN